MHTKNINLYLHKYVRINEIIYLIALVCDSLSFAECQHICSIIHNTLHNIIRHIISNISKICNINEQHKQHM